LDFLAGALVEFFFFTAGHHDLTFFFVYECSGYYKCSMVRGCPARKHVERDPREPAMLIVTYEGDHRHDASPVDQGTASAAITPAA
jgi:hypothetical protein